MGLSQQQIEQLLESEANRRFGYKPPERKGPIRFADDHRPCVNKGCATPTWVRFKGVPYCSPHLYQKANELFIELGIEK